VFSFFGGAYLACPAPQSSGGSTIEIPTEEPTLRSKVCGHREVARHSDCESRSNIAYEFGEETHATHGAGHVKNVPHEAATLPR